MAHEAANSGGYAREVRDTIIKSSLTGVAATVLAVTVFSPAGLGGMIGTSLASGLGLDASNTSADNVYANLPAYPAPLTENELTQIRGDLARTTASLEITRAATEGKIEALRSIAVTHDVVAFNPAPQAVTIVEPAPVSTSAPAAANVQPVSQTVNAGGGVDLSVPHSDPNMELAALLFAHENY